MENLERILEAWKHNLNVFRLLVDEDETTPSTELRETRLAVAKTNLTFAFEVATGEIIKESEPLLSLNGNICAVMAEIAEDTRKGKCDSKFAAAFLSWVTAKTSEISAQTTRILSVLEIVRFEKDEALAHADTKST